MARSQYLEFYADRATIDRIVTEKSLQRGSIALSRPDWDPSWWGRFPPESEIFSYDGDSHMRLSGNHEFYNEHEVLIYDTRSRQAYYRYFGNSY
jgi:hypothetical protein